jgi:hypothetical protein
LTQTSGFYTTSGAPSGHQVASYTQAIAAKAWAIMAACTGFEGVAPGYLNALVGSVPGANTARIGTGGAIVDGQWYQNDAAVDVTIPSAVGGGNTRIDRIVLRVTWASFQCIITRIAGTDAGSPTAPAITQTPTTTYDIMLYQALVNTSGAVTLTDERVMAGLLTHRQGGSATEWETSGSNNYTLGRVRIQAGVATTSAGGTVTVTFPVPFAYKPIVIATVQSTGDQIVTYWQTSATSVVLHTYTANSGAAVSAVVSWIAIGTL